MKTKYIIFIFLISVLGLSLKAETVIENKQEVSGTWTKEGSPYIIKGAAIIEAGQTLVIKPGVVIKLNAGEKINFLDEHFDVGCMVIKGTLVARGTENERIIFTRNSTEKNWGSIICLSESKKNIFEYCDFEYSFKTIGLGNPQIKTIGSLVLINAEAEIGNCNLRNFRGVAIQLKKSSPNIYSTTFTNRGKAILCEDKSSPIIVGCTFQKNSLAILCTKESNPQINSCKFFNIGYCIKSIHKSKPQIKNSLFARNKYAIICTIGSPANIDHCTFVNNKGFALIATDVTPIITNSIFWGNRFAFKTANFDISHSLIQLEIFEAKDSKINKIKNIILNQEEETAKNKMTNEGLLIKKLNDKFNIIGQDPLFVNEETFEISAKSPCISTANYKRNMGADILNLSSASSKNQRKQIITKKVNENIEQWQKKGKYEKTVDYKKRVNDKTFVNHVKTATKKAINNLGKDLFQLNIAKASYDADNELFKITPPEFLPFFVPVSTHEAELFDKNFNKLEIKSIDFGLTDEYEMIVSNVTIKNPANNKVYNYSSNNNYSFNSEKLNIKLQPVEINIATSKYKAPTETNISPIKSTKKIDVDFNIPINKKTNKNTYALIIGNEDYTKYQTDLGSEINVDFAKHDATIFAEYAKKTLGIPTENITLLQDAISSQMNREITKLQKLIQYSKGQANVIVYYAGHGMPHEQTKDAYIMPVDISGTEVENGIKLEELYKTLTTYPSKQVVVFIDACFSGGGRNIGLLAARAVKHKPKAQQIRGNIIVFSASSGDQTSLPYRDKQHGMFTYYLLKSLQSSKGNISLENLSNEIIDNVQLEAIKVNNKEQNPQILISSDITNTWKELKIRK